MERNKVMRFFLVLIFLISFGGVLASEYNETEVQSIGGCLENINLTIIKFENEGFNVVRLEDLRLMIKESSDSFADFDSVMSRCESVDKIDELAFDSRDFIDALKTFYEETDKSGVNMSSVDLMIRQIDLEFENERYEKIEEKVDEAYEEIIDIQSTSSSLKVFYSSTRGAFVAFFEDHYKEILGFAVFLIVFYFVFGKKIKIWFYRRKVQDRELRKEVIKDLISKTQKNYFSEGDMSEGMYLVRTKKFSEIIRNLDREILGFNEELSNLGVGKTVFY